MPKATIRKVNEVRVGWIIRGGASFEFGRKPAGASNDYVTVGYGEKYEAITDDDQIADASDPSRAGALFLVTSVFRGGARAVRLDGNFDYEELSGGSVLSEIVQFIFTSRVPALEYAVNSVELCGVGLNADTVQKGDVISSGRFSEKGIVELAEGRARMPTARDRFLVTDLTKRRDCAGLYVEAVQLIGKMNSCKLGTSRVSFFFGGYIAQNVKLQVAVLVGRVSLRSVGVFQMQLVDLDEVIAEKS